MKKVLVLIDYYLPGYKSGGPVRTISNMVDQLGQEIEFWILTRNRDVMEAEPYPDVQSDTWNRCKNSKVYYASTLGFLTIRRIVREVSPDVIYLNSFFSSLVIRYLVMRWLRLVHSTAVVLAPRGEFSPGALALKKSEKLVYLKLVALMGLYRKLVWQVSSLREAQEIQDIWKGDITSFVAPNMPPVIQSVENGAEHIKIPGEARFVFLSRISPKKNIVAAINMLGQLSGQVLFSIAGPVGDEEYWSQCQHAIKSLPPNVTVSYVGAIPHQQINSIFKAHHFFLLPTLGENFGHAILEALMAGCPVVISDQTPWRELQKNNIGWDLPLDSMDSWLHVLGQCINMDQATFKTMSASAKSYASQWSADSGILQANRELFLLACEKEKPR